jgi:hypothetical protein
MLAEAKKAIGPPALALNGFFLKRTSAEVSGMTQGRSDGAYAGDVLASTLNEEGGKRRRRKEIRRRGAWKRGREAHFEHGVTAVSNLV